MENYRMKLPMFDDYWIDFRSGTSRRWFKPEFFSMAPGCPYASVIFDPIVKKYRIYYESMVSIDDDDVRLLRMSESTDLKTFTPCVASNGSDIVCDGWYGLHGCSVIYDEFEKDISRRYKLCGMFDTSRAKRDPVQNDTLGVEIAFSPDGINFTRHPECKVCEITSDCLNKLVYNPLRNEYIVFHRAAFVDRRINITISKDLIHWSEPRVILQPGANNNNGFDGIQHYSMVGNFFDGLFYGLVWRYVTCLYNFEYTRMFGYMEPELVYSYDGQDFLTTTGEPVVERPYPPRPGCCGLAPLEIFEDQDKKNYFLMFNGYTFVHGTEASNAIYLRKLNEKKISGGGPLYRIRKDGFCGIESVNAGGLVVTKAISLVKDDLTFNIRANCGFVRFGIMDLLGNYYEGFSLDDSEVFGFDDWVDLKPMWKTHSLNELLNTRIRLVIELNTAILHCISATARPHVRQLQESFSRPMALIKR